jgi:hypothetical protein
LRLNISVTSGQSRDKKSKVTCTIPNVLDNLVNELRTATSADIDAVMISQVNEIIKVATTSSNPRGTYIKALKVAAGTLTAGIMENARRRIGPACSAGVQRLAEEKNEVLRKELARMAVSAPRKWRAHIRAIEDRLRGGRPTRKTRPRQEPVAIVRTITDTQLPSLGSSRVASGRWSSQEKRRRRSRRRRKP